MTTTPARSSHRRTVVGLAVTVTVLAVAPGVGVAGGGSHHRGSCPKAESLVPGTAWKTKSLAKGVTVSTGTAKDANGDVNMHVLRVDLTKPRVRVVPLVHSLAERSPLTALAAHKPRLVAATNTGYFDFQYGAPTDPFIKRGVPQVISNSHEMVVGIGKNGRLEAGHVWLSSTINAGGNTHSLDALNETYPPTGIGVYNRRWGSEHVPGGWNATTRAVTGGTLAAGQAPRHGATVPNNGYLLQARGSAASGWLNDLATGTAVSITSTVKTDAKSPFVQAYGVGLQLVEKAGVAKTGFSCDSANTKQPARTAIGWANGGRTMIIAVVAQHAHTSMHGLDNDQMSKLMVQLGVQQAYNFDGSGSTELLAKFRHSPSLKLQNYPADGAERPMPVGLGISVKPVKHRHHKKHH